MILEGLPEYEVFNKIGIGATSCVYYAVHRRMNIPVAVKVRSYETKEELAIINQEIEFMLRLKHPNIITLFDVVKNETNQTISMIMEYVSRGSLADRFQWSPVPIGSNDHIALKNRVHRIAKNNSCMNGKAFNNIKQRLKSNEVSRRLNEISLQKYFIQIAEALMYLHDQVHIVHRDLKLENILIDDNDDIKIIDFGMSHETTSAMKTRCGSPCYVSPEVIMNKPYSAQTDIWSLGIILFFMTTGKLPFYEENLQKLFQLVVEVPVDIPDYVNASDDLKDLIRLMLEKDPNDRITLAQVMCHPWVAGPKVTSDLPNLKSSINNRKMSDDEYSDKLFSGNIVLGSEQEKMASTWDASQLKIVDSAGQESENRLAITRMAEWSSTHNMKDLLNESGNSIKKTESDFLNFSLQRTANRAPQCIKLAPFNTVRKPIQLIRKNIQLSPLMNKVEKF